MVIKFVESLPTTESLRCDGEIETMSGIGPCDCRAAYMLLWLGAGGEPILLCGDCLRRLVEQGRGLLDGV